MSSEFRLSFAGGERFVFGKGRRGEPCGVQSVAVPDDHSTSTAGHAACTVWIEQPGAVGSVVVCEFALEHETVAEAEDEASDFEDFAAGGREWRFRRDDGGEFTAILRLEESAVAVYGVLAWSDEDVRQFLARVDVR